MIVYFSMFCGFFLFLKKELGILVAMYMKSERYLKIRVRSFKFKLLTKLLIMFILSLKLNSNPVLASGWREQIAGDNRYGGRLVLGTKTNPTIINPILTSTSISASLMVLIFNRLVRINHKGEIEPDLAKHWEISEDGLVYTFYLKKGVRFHDGVELTAEDVKFTYDKIMDVKTNSLYQDSYLLVEKWEVINTYSIKVSLRTPSQDFINKLTREIAPKHLLENADLEETIFNFAPVGTGPFKFKEWGKDNKIILETNEDYFEGRPYLDRIVVKTYLDSSALWSAFMRGEVDYVSFIEQRDYEIVKKDSTFKAYAVPIDFYYMFVYNLNDKILVDQRVRQAIAHAINRKELINKVAGGYGKECNGPFYPETDYFNPAVEPFEYNPGKAKELLAEAGWHDMDNNGTLDKMNEELELKALIYGKYDVFRKIAMFTRQELAKIGIKLKVVLFNDHSQLTDQFLRKHQAQLYLTYGLADTMSPSRAAEEWYSQANIIGKLWNYHNDQVDQLFELSQLSKRIIKDDVSIYHQIHQLIYHDQPACFLYFPFDFHAVTNRIKGTEEYFNIYTPDYKIKDWYIDKTKIERR